MSVRIISGTLRGRKLFSIPGFKVRPTSDRVKESVFNILAEEIRDARVLDLFAGTGALGIEALSRGSEFAFFLENDWDALKVIARNLQHCGLEDRSKYMQWNAVQNLNCLQSIRPAFDLVFMDPPYGKNFILPVLRHLTQIDALKKGAIIVVEHAVTECFGDGASEWALADQRFYGKTLVSFLHYMI